MTAGTSTNEEELLSLLEVSGVEILALSMPRPLIWKSKTAREEEIFKSPRGKYEDGARKHMPVPTQRISAVPAYFVRGTTLSAVSV